MKRKLNLFTILFFLFVPLMAGTVCAQTNEAGPFSAANVQTTEVSYLINLGSTEYNNGELENAKPRFMNALNYQPNNETALAYLGAIYYRSGSFEAALNTYTEILRIDPDRKGLYYDMGLSYMNQGRLKEALAAFEEVKKYFTDNPNVLLYDALAHYKAGELDESISELKSIIEKNPDYAVDPYFYLGQAYFYKGMADEASSYFNTVIRMSQGTAWGRSAREFIDKIAANRSALPKVTDFSIYANMEHDSNVAYSANPGTADADIKSTLFISLGYKPVINNAQMLKLGYSLYYLGYNTHTSYNFLGHIVEVALEGSPIHETLLTLKLNGNYYLLAGSPYLLDVPVELQYTFKALPGQGMWTVANGSYAIDTYPSSSYANRNCSTITLGLKQYLNDLVNIGFEYKTSTASGEPSSATEDYSYSSSEIFFGYVQPLPMDFSFSLDGSSIAKSYKMPDSYTISTVPTKRADTILNINATLAKTIAYEIGVLLKVGYYSDKSNLTSTTSGLGYGSYSSKTVSVAFSKTF